LILFFGTILFLMVMAGVTYYGIGWIKVVAGSGAKYIVAVLLLFVYLLLLWFACKVPELESSYSIEVLPKLGETAQAGYYFLVPVVVLMWCLVVERLSPGLAAFWATMVLIFIIITQRPLKGVFRKAQGEAFAFKAGWQDLLVGMVTGARNMIGIGVATAAAGIVVGTVTLTGIGLVMTQFVEFISGGNLILILFFTAVISLMLGMGLPTTANYIVVSTLMAPVIVNLGAENGLIVPLIAVHMFVFYFGILADDTPPVGLAAFAAAGISGGDPIRTGIQGFGYDIRTAVLPFLFIFNTELLMIGIGTWFHLVIVVAAAIVAMMMFAAGTRRFWLTKNRLWETAALLLVTFTLLRPGFWWDMAYPEFTQEPPAKIEQIAEGMAPGDHLLIWVKGEKLDGSEYKKVLSLPVGDEETGAEKLAGLGFETRAEGSKVFVDMVTFASLAEKSGLDFDQEIVSVEVPNDRPPKQLMFIPAFALLALIYRLQRGRLKKEEAAKGEGLSSPAPETE
jgi:TRAP transporter 4TM/12TM fusion protein